MNIKTNGTTNLEVMVDASDVLRKLRIRLGLADRFGEAYDLTNHNDIEGIYKIEDVSRHGSPTWEYTLITDKETDIRAFECVNYLLEYLEKKTKDGTSEVAV